MSSLPQPTAPGGLTSLPRGVAVLLGAAGAVIVAAGLRSVAGIVGPAFLALMIVISVHPLQAWLARHRVPSWLGVTLTLTVTYLILVGLAAALAISVARLATLLPTYGEQFTDLSNQVVDRLDDFGVTPDQVTSALSQINPSSALPVLQGILSGLANVLSDLLFLAALLFFLAVDAASFPSRLAAAAAERPALVAALLQFARGTRQYVVVSTIFGLIVAVVDAGALWWLGIPLPLLWGLLSFITNYIPNIGFVLGLVPPALLGLLEGGVRLMIYVVVAYSVINFVIQSLLQPKFVGDAVGLSITLTFLSLIFWSSIIGALGALLAVPLSLLAKALLVDMDPSARWMTPLISGAGPGTASVQQLAETSPSDTRTDAPRPADVSGR